MCNKKVLPLGIDVILGMIIQLCAYITFVLLEHLNVRKTRFIMNTFNI